MTKQYFSSTFVLLLFFALFSFSCEKQEIISPDTDFPEEITFRDGRPIPGLPEGSLGCWAGKWRGEFYHGPSSTVYQLTINFAGTYYSGDDGDWFMRTHEDGPILYSGDVNLYNFTPYNNGTTGFSFALPASFNYPFYGTLDKSCLKIQGPTHEDGSFSIKKVTFENPQ